jgi:uncharacterized membrane protein
VATEPSRSAARFDRWFPWAFAAAVAAVFFTLSWWRVHTLDAGFDVAYFKQAAWQLGHGEGGFLSVRGVHLFADHAYLFVYPIGWLGRVVPLTPLLLGLQAAGLAAAAVPLYRICRTLAGLGSLPAAVVLVVYALHPAIQNANVFEFHPETVTAPVAFLGAVWFGARERWVQAAVCVAVLLLSREDYVFVVAGLGLVCLLGGRRRPGLVLLGVSAAWFALVTGFMAQFPGAVEIRASRLQPFGATMPEAAGFLARHPRVLLDQLTRGDNLEVTLGLLGPLLFLPLLAPRWLIPGLGLELLYLISPVAPAHSIRFQYTLVPAVCAVLAGAFGLGWLLARRPWAEGRWKRVAPLILLPLVAAAVLLNIEYSTSSLDQRPWAWRHRDAVDRARLAAARVPPSDASVAASASILPLVAARRSAYFFPAPFAAYADRLHPPDPKPLAERIAGVRYLLIDTTTTATELHAELIPDVLRSLTESGAFERLWGDHGVEVWRRAAGPGPAPPGP